MRVAHVKRIVRENRGERVGGGGTHRGFVLGLREANLLNKASKARDSAPGWALMVCAVSLSYSSHCSQPPGSLRITPHQPDRPYETYSINPPGCRSNRNVT